MQRAKNIMIKFLSLFLALSMVLAISACGEPQKNENNPDRVLTDAEKAEKAKKETEIREKRNARFRKVLIEHKSLQVIQVSENQLRARLTVNINNKPKLILFSMILDKNKSEQFEIQDFTDIIRSEYPLHNLEISAYKFSKGELPLMGLEYSFIRINEDDNQMEKASQFVVFTINENLGKHSVISTFFEFPSKSKLNEWAQQETSPKPKPTPTPNPLPPTPEPPVETPAP